MATSSVYRFPKTKEDGSIEEERIIIDKDGSLKKVSEIIFTADSPTISESFTDEINSLILSGQIIIPTQEQAGAHIVDITDQLEEGKYTYSFVSKSGQSVKCGDIFRIFYNGLNVSEDVDVSEDRLSFTFSDLYSSKEFGLPNTRLVIDFIQAQGE